MCTRMMAKIFTHINILFLSKRKFIMKKLTSLLFIGLIFCTQLVLAHENHATLSEPDLQKIGKEAAANLTTQDPGLGFGKLPASWNDVPLKKAKIHKKYHGYTVVAVTN